MGNWIVENRVGRLVLVRVAGFASVGDVDAFLADFRKIVDEIANPKFVVCADYRAIQVWKPDVAERFVAIIKTQNPRIERSGLICAGDKPTAALQIERTVRAAGFEHRRSFRDVGAALAFVGEVLTADERNEAAKFHQLS
jgi:hypothetical protein